MGGEVGAQQMDTIGNNDSVNSHTPVLGVVSSYINQTMFRGKAVALLLLVALLQIISATQTAEDRLKLFYERINKSDAKYCADKSKLLPQCNECIPGLQKGTGSESCNEFISTSKKIRDEIKKLTDERYGDKPVIDRPFGLYPCKFCSRLFSAV